MNLRRTSSKPLTEKSKAVSYAYWLLSRQALSSKDIRARFSRRECPEEITEEVIESLVTNGYIDDDRWLRSMMQAELCKGHGRRWIFSKLLSRGWQPEEFEEVMEEVVTEEAEQEAASKLLKGKLRGKERKKALSALCRRGFVLSNLKEIP